MNSIAIGMTKLNSTQFDFIIDSPQIIEQGQEFLLKFNISEEFAGNYMNIVLSSNIIDIDGNIIKTRTTGNIRLKDHLIVTESEKNL